ncbi:MAG: hypothetical protein JWN48_2709 [Myxococcaceae bacterium]|nr:hypothetical protein [Myxococcaceae bacterium]
MAIRPRLSPIALVLLALGLLVALVSGAFATLLWTEWGHARVCTWLNRAVSDQIAGTLEVGSIEALSLGQLTARGVKLVPPTGLPAIEAERAVIDFSLRKLWAGQLGWSRADISKCLVRVSDDPQHKTNMEKLFAKPKEAKDSPDSKSSKSSKDDEGSALDLQSMVTSDCTLFIKAGDTELRLNNLFGIMRVHVLANGDTELRFDRYRGTIDKGLPTGELKFHDVAGEVTTAGKRLLRFDGAGRTHGAPVDFSLEIKTEPKKLVKIDARFPEPSPGSFSTLIASLWSKVSPAIDIDIRYGKPSHDEERGGGPPNEHTKAER